MSKNLQPAFPTKQYPASNGIAAGMSLRDYFAAKAMQGLLSSDVKASEEQFAEYSYKVADAMLSARE